MILKSFLKEEYLASSISKGFLTFTLFLSGAVPETVKITCFFPLSSETDSEFAATILVFHFGYSFGSCHSLLFINLLADIPRVGISAGLCFVFMCHSATSVSLMISVTRFLTKTDVSSQFLIHCSTH